MTSALRGGAARCRRGGDRRARRGGRGRARPRHRLARARHRRARQGDGGAGPRAAIRPMPAARALAQSLALKSAQPRYEAFLARAPSRIAAAARGRSGRGARRGAEALGARQRARRQRPAPLARSAQHRCSSWPACSPRLAGGRGAGRGLSPPAQPALIPASHDGRALLHHHRDQLSQRAAAYRPCL